MSDKDLKRLSDIAKEELKAMPTREQALQSFVSAGIMKENGELTAPYAILKTITKSA